MLSFSHKLPKASWVISVLFGIAFSAPIASAQNKHAQTASAQTSKARGAAASEDAGPGQGYRGVSIGMVADEVRKKLGNPSDKGEEQDFFVLSDNETAQVVYDKSKKVVTLSFDFMSGAREIPTPKSIFGSDIEPKADGSMYRMVRYPKAGYWLSFNRTAGDSPLTSITFQKIEQQ
jgi:hypothetical protein